MIECGGIFLPDGEAHLVPYIETSPKVDGKGTYQLHKLEMALKRVKQRRLAVDVGAHVGLWSRIMALYFERVEAFEPVPSHLECFERNVSASNVRLHRYALGATEGWVKLAIAVGNSGSTHVSHTGDLAAEVWTLDSFNLTDLDFLKVDCEGYEEKILQGAVETLRRERPVVIVEQKRGNGSRYATSDFEALNLLKKLGGKIVDQKAGDYVVVL